MHSTPKETGWIEVVSGCMFSGKTEELIRRLKRAQYAKQKIKVFKPHIDDRYSKDMIVSHSEHEFPSAMIKQPGEILDLCGDAEVIGIDEAQFFSPEIVGVCNTLADRGLRVIVAGLDQDYKGVPFEPMPQLMAVAEYVTKTLAICVECGNPADRTQRKTAGSGRVDVGAADKYEARCRRCHYIPEE